MFRNFRYVLIAAHCCVIAGCSNNGGSNSLFSNKNSEGPVQIAGKDISSVDKAQQNALTGGPTASIKVAIDQADLKKAVHRYKLSQSSMSGTHKIVGADLNGDGVGEGLVFFQGDDWCVSTGCQLVVFVKGANGFRKMSVTKRVKLPLVVSPQFSEGWRDLIVRSGNGGIGEHLVRLRFAGNYPANASTVKEKLAALPGGHEMLINGEFQAVSGAPAN